MPKNSNCLKYSFRKAWTKLKAKPLRKIYPHRPAPKTEPILKKGFKVTWQIGNSHQKERLNLMWKGVHQGRDKGNCNQGSLLRAELRSYLEGKTNLSLPKWRCILGPIIRKKVQLNFYLQLSSSTRARRHTSGFPTWSTWFETVSLPHTTLTLT